MQQKIDEVKKNIEEIETRLGLTEQLRAEVQVKTAACCWSCTRRWMVLANEGCLPV